MKVVCFHLVHNLWKKYFLLWSLSAKLANATTILASFDLWMSKGGVDTFVFVINYLTKAWELMHVIIGLFKVNETIAIIA
jgi:hypothetical protein